MRKTLSLVLAVLLLLVLLPAVKLQTAVADSTAEVTLDFTTNTWELPTAYSKETKEYTDSVTGHKITMAPGSAGDGYKFGNKFLIFGKTGATLTLSAFSFDVEKIVVTGNSGASGSTLMNVFVGETAVSTETAGCKEANTYEIDAASQAAGTVYTLKVNNAYNAQITKIEIFKKSSEPVTNYNVTLVANNGTATTDTAVTTGSSYTLPECAFDAPEGKAFTGWTVGEDTTLRAPGYKVTGITAALTVTAQWGFEITFNHNDAETNPTTTKKITGPDGILTDLPAAPTFAKHTFVNWFDAPTGDAVVDFTKAFASATTVFAHWNENTDMQIKNTIAAGDEVVIYNANGNVMTATAHYYNNTKYELAAADAVLTSGVLSVPTTAAVFTVSETKEGETTYYSFKTGEKWLSLDGTNVNLVDEPGDGTLFTLDNQDLNEGVFYIKNTKITAENNVLEYFKGYYTCYKPGTGAAYNMSFYAVPGETPEPPTPPTPVTNTTVILFTNDVHCEVNYTANTYNENGTLDKAGNWGYGRVAGLKKQYEAQGNDVILVDAGDHVQGGPIGSLTKGTYIIDIMNAVGYDLAVPGNHEFDYNMDQFLNTIVPRANYPYLSANFKKIADGKPVFDAYKIIEATGRKIAFVGLSTPESFTKSTPTYFQNAAGEYIYSFCENEPDGAGVAAAAQEAIDAARTAGADYVIVVGHLGVDEQSSPWMSTEIISKINGIDAFIDGHSHTVVNRQVEDKDGKKVLLAQTGTKLANIGVMKIDADGITVEIKPVDDTVQPDPTAQAVIDTINEEFDALLKTKVAYTDHLLTVNNPDTGKRAVRSAETNLGDLCADAYLYKYNHFENFSADIAFVNGGGVRADIPTGDITFEQIIKVHPFGNTAVLVKVTGQTILDALEMGARNVPTSENGGFLQVAGLTYEIHTDVEPNVKLDNKSVWIGPKDPTAPYRVQNVKVWNKTTEQYEPLDLNATYNLAGHNYMLEDSGDGFAMFKTAEVLNRSGILDNQVLIDYIQSMPKNADGKYEIQGYINPKGEGRIKILNGDIVVLFTNDVHCGIEDGWGYAGLAKVKKDLEEGGYEVLLVDAGDHVQGGPIGSLTKGTYIIDIMNAVGYDLAVPGNHEFDYGMDQFLNTLVPRANYPYLSANFVDLVHNSPNGTVFDAYKIFNMSNGKKVAFVGLSTPETFTKSTPAYFQNDAGDFIYSFCEDDTGIGVITAAQHAVDAAKAEGADYVIVVGHMGVDAQSSPWMATEVIAGISGVDAFIDGHSHTVINAKVKDKDNKDVLHGQTGTKLANIGKLTIAKDGTLTMALLPASEKTGDDPEVKEVVDTINTEFDALLKTKIAYTDHLLTVNDPDTGKRAVRSAETNLGDLCADAYLYKYNHFEDYEADIAFVNGGGVRADIAAGDITFEQIIKVHPFGNTAVLIKVTGQTILDALEMGARECPKENGGFIQVAGLTYEIHTSTDANVLLNAKNIWIGPKDPTAPYRVQNVKVWNKTTEQYEPLDLNATYNLAGHNYMLEDSGDGFAMFKNAEVLNRSGILDNQVLIDYIQSMPEQDGKHFVTGYTDPKGEGRIKVVREDKFFGENVASKDIMEYAEDGRTLYAFPIKVRGIKQSYEVVGLQTYLSFDTSILKFVEARTTLEGAAGQNEANGLFSFAWAADPGKSITLTDNMTVVTLYFELLKPVVDGTKVEIKFVPSALGESSGYSYLEGDTVVEADQVILEDGSITFAVMDNITLYGKKNTDETFAAKIENGEALYRYDIYVSGLPESGLKVNSAQIFLTYDHNMIEFRSVEGLEGFEWYASDDGEKMMAAGASDESTLIKNGTLLSVYFVRKAAPGGVEIPIEFTVNDLGFSSSLAVIFGGSVREVESVTEDGSMVFLTMPGDANCDGRVTSADAAMVLRSVVQLTQLTAAGAVNADVDGDGEITANDAVLILQYIVGLVNYFPVEAGLID